MSVATVEEFIRHSGVRFVDDLHLLEARARQWWTEGEGLDPKKVRARASGTHSRCMCSASGLLRRARGSD